MWVIRLKIWPLLTRQTSSTRMLHMRMIWKLFNVPRRNVSKCTIAGSHHFGLVLHPLSLEAGFLDESSILLITGWNNLDIHSFWKMFRLCPLSVQRLVHFWHAETLKTTLLLVRSYFHTPLSSLHAGGGMAPGRHYPRRKRRIRGVSRAVSLEVSKGERELLAVMRAVMKEGYLLLCES